MLFEPTVLELGELLDQMVLVEGFYGMGPVFGILSSGYFHGFLSTILMP